MRIRFREIIERIRDSQFLIPAVVIALGLALAVATNALDRSDTAHPLTIESSIATTRTLLASVAGAIVTVAALVFSLSAVTIQLAASQYSPRVVQGLLRDRLQQTVVGMAMATFTYALSALATLPSDTDPAASTDWTATTAVVLAIVTVVLIVAFIDHMTRQLRVDDTIRRITDRTLAAFAPRLSNPPVETPWSIDEATASVAIRADRSGFIQEIALDELLAMLPPETIVRLDVWVGHFVSEGRRVMTVWTDKPDDLGNLAAETVAIGDQRTIEQDPALGFRQLIDIALRALSSGINDPATAADVVRHLAACLRAAYLAEDPVRVYHGAAGVRLATPHAPSVDDYVTGSIPPIRRAGADHPVVLTAIIDSLEGIDDELAERGRDGTAIRREVELTREALEHTPAETGSPQPNSGPR